MNIFYAHEKFNEAVRLLATGRGDLRSRLSQAFVALAPVQEEDLPENLRGDLGRIRSKMTERDPGSDEGQLPPALERMKDRTTERIAEKIVELDSRLSSHLDEYDI